MVNVMLREVREILDKVEGVLLKSNQASADLAAILSALRSKDTDILDDKLKMATTMPLRSHVFPALFKWVQRGGSVPCGGTRCWAMTKPINLAGKLKVESPDGPQHFEDHFNLAIDALMRED